MNLIYMAALSRARRRTVACSWTIVVLALGLLGGLASTAFGERSRARLPLAATTTQPAGGVSLEAAANKAGSIGRNVAMSLIGLGFAVAATRLVFRRNFKEAAGVLVVGLLAIALATPAGVNVLRDTVNTLFGA